MKKAIQPTPVDRILADPATGLTGQEAALRLENGWGNQVNNRSGRTVLVIIRENTLTFFNLIFVVMAVLMLLVNVPVLELTFMGVVIINIIIGCVQELRAKHAVDKLTLVAAQTLPVLRDGQIKPLPSHLLVRDDIVEFRAGDQICADGILATGQVQVNESLVTGEADAILKNPGDPLLSGSFVVAGTGRARLTRVGEQAFAAKLAAEAKKDPKAAKSEMMQGLDKLIHVIGFALIPVGLLLFFNQMRLDSSALQANVKTTIAALVGMIPEGLYLLTSVALALSAIKLTRRRVLVQDMNCIETLARVDVLCVDKTGTITEPEMTLEQVIPLTEQDPTPALTALFGATPPENDTGKALYDRFRGESPWQCIRRIPFTSQEKWSGAVFADHGAFLAGAPECILGGRYDALRPRVEALSQTGSRVLLLAQYRGDPAPGQLDSGNVIPLALLTLCNRIRETAPETFSYFARQGVTIKVISGDHPATVSAVAGRAGITGSEDYVDAATLETDEQIRQAALDYTVFGRVTPDKKRALIRALKENGHTVAMTGDGVNDVLAMKDADCGIAMASGAQAAKQVARLVLLDSDFSAMPDIVNEGRRVINNIQRSAALFLVKNIFSLGFALITLFASLHFPLTTFHFTIMAALTIGIPGFFLALEPNYERVTGKFLPNTLRKALPGGLTNILVVLLAQALMGVFHLSQSDGQTLSTAVLLAVGLTVLLQVSLPFSNLRLFLWLGMFGCAVGAFFVLPPVCRLMEMPPYLALTDSRSLLVLPIVLIMVPTVYFFLSRLFVWGDKLRKKQR